MLTVGVVNNRIDLGFHVCCKTPRVKCDGFRRNTKTELFSRKSVFNGFLLGIEFRTNDRTLSRRVLFENISRVWTIFPTRPFHMRVLFIGFRVIRTIRIGD